MARFDLHHLSRGQDGYVVDVQSSHLDYLGSRVVAPLRKRTDAEPVADLHPEVEFGGARYVLMTHAVFAMLRREMGPVIGNLAAYRDEITRAFDLLLTGF